MIINIGVEVIAVEAVDEQCPLLRDMQIAQMLTDDGTVFGLDQRVVIGMSRAGLGEFDEQLMEQLRHPLVDVFRTVVGMEALESKGELFQELLQNRDQVVLADFSTAQTISN